MCVCVCNPIFGHGTYDTNDFHIERSVLVLFILLPYLIAKGIPILLPEQSKDVPMNAGPI